MSTSNTVFVAMLLHGNTMGIETAAGLKDRFTVHQPKKVSPEMFVYLSNPTNGKLRKFMLWQQPVDAPWTWESFTKYGGVAKPIGQLNSSVATIDDMNRQMKESLLQSKIQENANMSPAMKDAVAAATKAASAAQEKKLESLNTNPAATEEEAAALLAAALPKAPASLAQPVSDVDELDPDMVAMSEPAATALPGLPKIPSVKSTKVSK